MSSCFGGFHRLERFLSNNWLRDSTIVTKLPRCSILWFVWTNGVVEAICVYAATSSGGTHWFKVTNAWSDDAEESEDDYTPTP
jgi:hypothetical protein